jgi:hypothetical protein
MISTLFPPLTTRGWFLNHLVRLLIRASEDSLLHLFCRNGFFRFPDALGRQRGLRQAIKENTPSNGAQFYWAPVDAVRVLFRDLHYVTISVW